MKVSKRTLIFLAVALSLCILSGFFASMVNTSAYSVTVTDVRENIGTGAKFSFYIYKPNTATKDAPAPAIVTSHGYLNNREMQDINAVEWSKRGFVVIAMDMEGHGNSDMSSGGLGTTAGGMIAAVEYAAKLEYVDATKIGVSGHSMGGMAVNIAAGNFTAKGNAARAASLVAFPGDAVKAEAAYQAANLIKGALLVASDPSYANIYNTSAVIGTIAPQYDEFFYAQQGKYTYQNSLIPSTDKDKTNKTKYEFLPRNYLSSPNAALFVKQSFNGLPVTERNLYPENDTSYTKPADAANLSKKINVPTEAIKAGVFYTADGEVAKTDGTAVGKSARVIYSPSEIHPWAHFSLNSAASGSAFWYGTFGTPTDAKFIAPTSETWWLKETFNFVGLVGFFMLLLPLAEILLATPLFASLNGSPSEPPMLKGWKRHVPFWVSGALITLFGGFSIRYFVSSSWGWGTKFFPLTPAFPQDTTNYVAVWAIACAIFAMVVWGLFWFFIGRKEGDKPSLAANITGKNFLKTLLMTFIVVGVMWVVVFFNQAIWTTDYRLWSFAVRTFEPVKFPTMLRYFVIFAVYYGVNSFLNTTNRFKNLPEWVTIAITAAINVLGIILVFAIQYGVFFSTGAMWQWDMKLPYIVLFTIIPTLILAAIFARKLYLKTGNFWLGGLVNALLFTMITVANTSISFPYILG